MNQKREEEEMYAKQIYVREYLEVMVATQLENHLLNLPKMTLTQWMEPKMGKIYILDVQQKYDNIMDCIFSKRNTFGEVISNLYEMIRSNPECFDVNFNIKKLNDRFKLGLDHKFVDKIDEVLKNAKEKRT